MKSAVLYAGTSPTLVYNWLSRARDIRPADGEYFREDIPESERPYVDFLEAVTQAEGMAEVELVTIVRAAARTNWQCAVTMLARRFPHWRETQRLEVSESAEETDTMQMLQQRPEMVAQLAALAHQLEDARQSRQVVEAEVVEDRPETVDWTTARRRLRRRQRAPRVPRP